MPFCVAFVSRDFQVATLLNRKQPLPTFWLVISSVNPKVVFTARFLGAK